MTDVAGRLRAGMPLMLGVFAIAALAGIEKYGWLPLVPPAAGILLYGGVWLLRAPSRSRPEYAYAAAFVFAEAMIALAIVLGPAPHGYALSLLAIPMMLASVLFPTRVVLAFVAYAVVLLLVVTLGFDLPEVRAIPAVAYGELFVLVTLAVIGFVIRDLDDASRRSAFFDELTGVLNRAALAPRVAELAVQTETAAEPVAVILADIDHFKAINDQLGHVTGDYVLREVARRLSGCLSAFEPLYRLGGEEFLILLPGRDATEARGVAERLWRAAREKPVADLPLTMSFGVASSEAGARFDFDVVFARADRALYVAKQEGRDLVRLAPAEGTAAALEKNVTGGARREHDRDAILGDSGAEHSEAPLASVEQLATARRGWTLGAGASRPTTRDTVTDELELEHVLDLNRRLRVLFRVIALGAFVIIASEIPRYGWHTLIAPAVGGAVFYLLSRNASRFRRPTRALGTGWVIFQTSIAVGFASSLGAPLFALPLLALMVPGRCAVLRTRAAAAGTAYTAFLVVCAALYLDASRVAGNPAIVLFPIAAVVTAGFVGAIVGASAVDFRGAGVVDDLTGLLNRTALGTRVLELGARAANAPHSVAIVLADLDHFKNVNDRAGHSAGDRVLREVAARIRTALRTFDSAYRVGGEEFLVLLPDANVADAVAVAERLHDAVRAEACEGWPVTVSVGVAATRPGSEFVYEELFSRADAALYEAKRLGRDRIHVDAPASATAAAEDDAASAVDATAGKPMPPAMGSAA
jgi:diguanylate cyclase (GGDEF)-like protein